MVALREVAGVTRGGVASWPKRGVHVGGWWWPVAANGDSSGGFKGGFWRAFGTDFW